MKKEVNSENLIRLLDRGISLMKDFGDIFVAYNTQYLGSSATEEYRIRGKSTKGSKALDEFCYGYDGEYNQLHLLHVYEMVDGTKYAAIERSMNVYSFWDILN